jgi:hypothetical protein
LVADWLPRQVHREHRAIMRKKAAKFLTAQQRDRVNRDLLK